MSVKVKRSGIDIVFDVINYTMIFIILVITLYPLLYALSASFSDPMAIVDGSL